MTTTNSNTEADGAVDSGLLDEQAELYGYGVFNVHHNRFVPKLGTNGEQTVFTDEEEAIEHFLEVVEELTDGYTDHLRLVRVTLDNALDAKAAEALEEGGR